MSASGSALYSKLQAANPRLPIESVDTPSFAEFGRLIDGLPTNPLVDWMSANVPIGFDVAYQRSVGAMEDLAGPPGPGHSERSWKQWATRSVFGGGAAQVGWVAGRNSSLNAFEYHKSSECLIAATPLVLLIGRMGELEAYASFDSSRARAYFVEQGQAIELYANALHFSPIMAEASGFRAAIILPLGTNAPIEGIDPTIPGEDGLLRAERKWLLACPDTKPAKSGARVGMENVTINPA